MEEMTEGVTALAELLPLIGESTIRMIPFAEHVGVQGGNGRSGVPGVVRGLGPRLQSPCFRPGREQLA